MLNNMLTVSLRIALVGGTLFTSVAEDLILRINYRMKHIQVVVRTGIEPGLDYKSSALISLPHCLLLTADKSP